ncbi:hypothetical protein NEOLEDRAFT_1128189 [Neolentinus lepideus HHB14362 ss-1]|uniref:Uncharacterized protein n=1 Tax=Neolentinus lepideus HHB14362 ss-1 TaxID=1314782 RepID=A0A165VB36_9AGAM|nr:hypothetical protein NEOLEDRAFT_1128189 [Neolentinus lepideus HHB14362 ss-1]
MLFPGPNNALPAADTEGASTQSDSPFTRENEVASPVDDEPSLSGSSLSVDEVLTMVDEPISGDGFSKFTPLTSTLPLVESEISRNSLVSETEVIEMLDSTSNYSGFLEEDTVVITLPSLRFQQPESTPILRQRQYGTLLWILALTIGLDDASL